MIISIKKQRANKDYICGLSGKKILKGEIYYRYFQKCYDVIDTTIVCEYAKNIVDEMWDACGNAIEEYLDKECFEYLLGN